MNRWCAEIHRNRMGARGFQDGANPLFEVIERLFPGNRLIGSIRLTHQWVREAFGMIRHLKKTGPFRTDISLADRMVVIWPKTCHRASGIEIDAQAAVRLTNPAKGLFLSLPTGCLRW